MINRIKVLRESRNMTIEELARIAGVDGKTIVEWETGTKELSIEGAVTLCKYFEVTMDFLICINPPKGDECIEQIRALICHPEIGDYLAEMFVQVGKITDHYERIGFIEGWIEAYKAMHLIKHKDHSK